MDSAKRKDISFYHVMDEHLGEVIVSSREYKMWSWAEWCRSERNFIVEVLLSDLRFGIWIWGSWLGVQGLIVIDLVDKIEESIEEIIRQ